MLRTKYNRKVSVLKDHVRSAGETMDQERSLSDHQITMMREELARTKEMIAEANRREAQLQSFRYIAKLKYTEILLSLINPNFQIFYRQTAGYILPSARL